MSEEYLNLVVVPNFHGGKAIVDMSKVLYIKKSTCNGKNSLGVVTTVFQFKNNRYVYTNPSFDLMGFISELPQSLFLKHGGPFLKAVDHMGDTFLINFDLVSIVTTANPDTNGERTIVYIDGIEKPLYISIDVDEILTQLREDDIVLNVELVKDGIIE